MTRIPERFETHIANALRVAAEQYTSDMKYAIQADQPRIAAQFRRQAIEAVAIADAIEGDGDIEREVRDALASAVPVISD